MTLRIAIGLSFYEDFDSLRRMIQSCQSYPIDMIIAVDGRYKGFDSKNGISSQKCIDLFKASQTPFDIDVSIDKDQNVKRQRYMDLCAPKAHDIDCLIVMDSDEYFIHEGTNWPLFIEDLEHKIKENENNYKQGYCIPTLLIDKGIQRMPEGYYENLPRLFHKPHTLRYVDDHFSIRNKQTGSHMTFEGNSVLNHITLGHDHDLRTIEYSRLTKEYQENLIKEENAIRKQRQDDFVRTIQST
jgi:hypothetical protein